MEEKTEIKPDEEAWATTPENRILIPVKFNKEVKNLTVEEATLLSQKGMKYDAIEKQWERLRAFAREENSSTAEFLDALEKRRTENRIEELTKECGGNSEMAIRIVQLEKPNGDSLKGEKDFLEYFPKISIDELPDEVLNRAKQNNSNILDEYLRYKARLEIEAEREEKQRRENAESTVGSQKDSGIFRTPENEQFIRGLWNK